MTTKRCLAMLLSTVALLPVAAPAMADGPTISPPPAAPILAATPAPDWSGFYGGLTLGYGVGTYGNDTNFPGDGEGQLEGAVFGGVVGYAFQNGDWVYGPELGITGSNLEGSEACVNPAFRCAVEVNYIASLRGNVGYLVMPDTLLFGTLGLASANVDVFTDNGAGPFGTDHNVLGYQIGVGVEWAMAQNTHLRATLSHYRFNEDDYPTDVLYSDVGLNATVLDIGLMFRF